MKFTKLKVNGYTADRSLKTSFVYVQSNQPVITNYEGQNVLLYNTSFCSHVYYI